MYHFEWSTDLNGNERRTVFASKPFESDKKAVASALAVFRHRTDNPNDELWIYEDERCLGKIAYNLSGFGFKFFKSQV